MLYIIEFCIALCVLVGLALYGVFLISPVASVVAALLVAYWLFKNEARGGLAIFGASYALPALLTIGVHFAR
ncbi:MAG: hypothetical protein WC714_19325 [Candidatus Obscuribacterales bacterium]|jgi:hypothetical protein